MLTALKSTSSVHPTVPSLPSLGRRLAAKAGHCHSDLPSQPPSATAYDASSPRCGSSARLRAQERIRSIDATNPSDGFLPWTSTSSASLTATPRAYSHGHAHTHAHAAHHPSSPPTHAAHHQSHSTTLLDSYSRRHTYLRISLTERCSFRCLYCMPKEGVPLTPDSRLLTTAEIRKIAAAFVAMGVDKVRLTGGEPLLRKDIVDIVAHISKDLGVGEVGLTTNGLVLDRFLDDLVQAGLTHLNISLDSLRPQRFSDLTRMPQRALEKVTRAIDRALEVRQRQLAGGQKPLKVKVNVVVMKGINDDEVRDFVEFTRTRDIDVRFIEYMPFFSNSWSTKSLLPSSDILSSLTASFPPDAIQRSGDSANDTTRHYTIRGYAGRFGFISSMTDHFCGTCNRVRVLADGNLKVCLFGNKEVSLRDAIRERGPGESQEDADLRLKQLISLALDRKHYKHAGLRDPRDIWHAAEGSNGLFSGSPIAPRDADDANPWAELDDSVASWEQARADKAKAPRTPSDDNRKATSSGQDDGLAEEERIWLDAVMRLTHDNSTASTHGSSAAVPQAHSPASTISYPTPSATEHPPAANHSSAARPRLTHLNEHTSQPSMVNITNKAHTQREATAIGKVIFPSHILPLLVGSRTDVAEIDSPAGKGPVFTTARLAGIMAAKRTPELIPLCHSIALDGVDVDLSLVDPAEEGAEQGAEDVDPRPYILIEATAFTRGATGVEMEALTGVMGAAATVWDMLKSVAGMEMEIADVMVTRKSGGKRGDQVCGAGTTATSFGGSRAPGRLLRGSAGGGASRGFSTCAGSLRQRVTKTYMTRYFYPTVAPEQMAGFLESASADPAEDGSADEALSMLIQGGYIRQSSSGVFTFLPPGLKLLHKVERIIEEEMEGIGSSRIDMPTLLPNKLWKKSGRDAAMGSELYRLRDRKGANYILAPTHEEEVTKLVGSEVQSYKDLPVKVYQMTRKHRDEPRPRMGLLRTREFVMKDMYSFDATVEDAHRSYDDVQRAYNRIMGRLFGGDVGSDCSRRQQHKAWRVAEADTGAMGGSKSHEYHVEDPAGEDDLLVCNACSYTANTECAQGHPPGSTLPTISSDLAVQLWAHSSDPVNAGALAAVVYPRSLSLNPVKVSAQLAVVYTNANQEGPPLCLHPGPQGQIHWDWKDRPEGPMIRFDRLDIIADVACTSVTPDEVEEAVEEAIHAYASQPGGAATADAATRPRLRDYFPGAQVAASEPASDALPSAASFGLQYQSLHSAQEGFKCPSCRQGELQGTKAIEVGHTFLLGTRYSEALKYQFAARPGEDNKVQEKKFLQMGCYGLGVTRLLGVLAIKARRSLLLAERSGTDGGEVSSKPRKTAATRHRPGFLWPKSLAPFTHMVILESPAKSKVADASTADAVRAALDAKLAETVRTFQAGARSEDGAQGELPSNAVMIDDRGLARADAQRAPAPAPSLGGRLRDADLLGVPEVWILSAKLGGTSGDLAVDVKVRRVR